MSANTPQSDTPVTPSETVERDPRVPGLELRTRGGRSAWYLAYRTKEGRRRHPKLGDLREMNRTKARARALAILGEKSEGSDPGEQGTRRSGQDLFDAYLAKHAEKRKRPSSVAGDRRLWALHATRLHRLPLASITTDDIEDIHRAMRRTPYQANRVAALLRKMFRLAVKWKWLAESPVAVEHYPEHQRRRVPSTAEAQAILRQFEQDRLRDPFFTGLVLMLVFTGARVGEWRTATWPQVTELGLMVMAKAGPRVIYLTTSARRILEAMPRESPAPGRPDLIFPYQSNVRRKWLALLKRAGVTGLRVHDIRRWYASAGVSAGLSLEAVGQLLGHTQAQTTKRYAYLVTEAAREASEAVALRILAAPPKAA